MKTILKLKSAVFLLLVSFVFTGCLNDLFEQRDNTLDDSVRQLAVFPASKSVNEPAGGAADLASSPRGHRSRARSAGVARDERARRRVGRR